MMKVYIDRNNDARTFYYTTPGAGWYAIEATLPEDLIKAAVVARRRAETFNNYLCAAYEAARMGQPIPEIDKELQETIESCLAPDVAKSVKTRKQQDTAADTNTTSPEDLSPKASRSTTKAKTP